ncbi:ClbS/DfsB family four-helix bundle protein [Aquimarina sp. 2201CG5-10]|uniref:ClbS/DfsB family four-helix bundle protein n=1 Tax=Aquimarina callyspongiae TaxID=3098150 RepID=UPI002AB40C96|nr:ClbS/DfsB family four-helix bundle protein [Aquimarina sp. 2201CG5-10]MDY8134205.1 ClbS/DfsB family four-helix bundle protein [Aquimarina sp. 2201CG5-10]
MAIPKTKEELLLAIEKNYTKLREDLIEIPVQYTEAYELEGHAKNTKMSVCNLVSYLIGWGELVLKWNSKKIKNEEVDFPETGYKWNELGRLAQKFYEDYSDIKYDELLEKLDAIVLQIIVLIKHQDDHHLYQIPWYEKWTMGRMIQLNTVSPYKNARSRIRKWKKEKNLK